MKPLRIEFSAFGSFPGEVSVDFTVLAARGLFVVTGDTGTGKTTVFDAMSYALFGDMPSKDGNDIRSHHADPSAQTYARFTFELDGHVHVAERAPEYQRAKQRGTGTTREPAKGIFVRIEGDGSTKELASGIRDMNRVVPEVVGLDATQFRRVMLLPQGEVAKFLLDDSANREALLGALFGGDIYTRIGEVLEEEAKSLRAQVHESEEKIRHHTTNALARLSLLHTLLEIEPPEELTKPEPGLRIDRERLGQIAATIDAPYDQLLSDAEARRSDAQEARRAAEAAENTIKRMREAAREAAEAHRKLAALAKEEPSVLAEAEAAEASRRARPVLSAEDRFKVAEQLSARASGELAKLTEEIHQIAVEHGLTVPTALPAMALKYVSEVETINAAEARQLDALNDKVTRVQDLQQRVESDQGGKAKLEATRAAAVEELEAIAQEAAALGEEPRGTATLDSEHRALLDALRDLATRDRLAGEVSTLSEEVTAKEHEYESLLRHFIDTAAPRLAAQLRNGEPCAVCGSVDHPAPAVGDGSEPVDFATVERARVWSVDANNRLRASQEELQHTHARLGKFADAQGAEIESSIAANRELHDKVTEADARRSKLELHLQETEGKINQIDGQLMALNPDLTKAEAERAVAEVAAAGIDRDALDRRRHGIERLRSPIDQLGAAAGAVREASIKLKEARDRRDEALLASGFVDIETAKACLLHESDELKALEARDRLKEDRIRLKGHLEVLADKDLPEVEPDLSDLEAKATEADKVANAISERRTSARDALEAFQIESKQIGSVDANTADLRRLADLTQRAQLVCRGQVAPKVSLRRWVLGRELERVVDAASQHLTQMSGGRYTLRRVTDSVGGNSAKGLDLEVLDAHTGRARKPNSLSGGEQFQASLSLALGLADVVSRGGAGNGRRIEALFVDEGFGSLDPRALDDAIETLHHLQATGRMVGAITHVETMKERLHAGIVVTQLADGHGSTLTVNP